MRLLAAKGACETVRGVLLTVAFCVAVAVLLTAVGMAAGFGAVLVISLSIGLSLHCTSLLLGPRLSSPGRWFLGPVVVTVVGVGIGLLLAGTLVGGNPLLFFSRDNTTLIAGVFFGVVGLLLFSTREDLLKARASLAAAEAAREREARRALESELRVLQAQIEPHFLFNTLSNVVSLIHSDPSRAEATLQNLARLLRTSLHRSRRELATLGDELELVSAYLEIQQVRMGSRLDYRIDVPATLRDVELAPMLLQPLVENAVLHGVEPLLGPGAVVIEARVVGRQLQLTVSDTGDGVDLQTSGAGVGLRNVRDRLDTLYGGSASLELMERSGGGFSATLRLPLPA